MARLLEPNLEIISGYRLIRYLGRGGFGEVWESEAPGGLSKAIKVAPMENSEDALNSRELDGLQKMRTIRHPYLLSIERFEVIDGFLVIVMELADRSLADRLAECLRNGLSGIPRDELIGYMHEAAEVLDLMNEKHELQHLDIKPENLFLSGGHVKVADFGLVQPRNTNMSISALAISPPYAPPELFDGRVEATADQYSLAVTYQELLTGTRPYPATDVRGLIFQHLTGRPDLSALPASDRPIIGRAIQRDDNKRYASCTDLVDALSNATSFGITSVSQRPPTVAAGSVAVAVAPVALARKPDSNEQAKALFVRRNEDVSRPADETVRVQKRSVRTGPIHAAVADVPIEDEVLSTFVAFLPIEIYAHKLRGFIDAFKPEILDCTDEKTILRFQATTRGWFGFQATRGLFMEIDAVTLSPHSGYRVVEVNIFSSSNQLRGQDLVRRAMLLIRCLKSYLMATDSITARTLKSHAQLKSEIFG